MSKHYTKFPPDHSTCKEYPWDGAKTLTSYPNDKRFTAFEKVVVDPEKDNYVSIGGEKFMHKKIKELACRLIDAEHALVVAETQIQDMCDESPFVPEEFGFEAIYKNEDLTEAPIKIYASKYDSSYSLHRVVGTDYGWKLLKKGADETFSETDLNFPCHRIAYAAFVALDIQVETEGDYINTGVSVFVPEAPVLAEVADTQEITLEKRIKRTRKALGMTDHSADKNK